MNTAINLKERWFNNSGVMFHNKITTEFVDTRMLRENGYPNGFIRSVLEFKRNSRKEGRGRGNREKNTFASLQYVGQSSLIIRKFLEKLDPRICVAFGTENL